MIIGMYGLGWVIGITTNRLVYSCERGEETRWDSGSLNVACRSEEGDRVSIYVDVMRGQVMRGRGRVM